MKRKTNKDVLELIGNFQKTLENNPPLSKMYKEIQMMKFKVKPIHGNFSVVNLNNEKFIKALWSLGKLDDFFQKEFRGLSSKNKELFSKILESIYQKCQMELNKADLQVEEVTSDSGFLEVEIFKELKEKKVN